MNKGNYNVWPQREELLKIENITNKIISEKKFIIFESKECPEINYTFLNKKRNFSFINRKNNRNDDSINCENVKIKRKSKHNESLEFKNKIKELEKKIKNLKLKINEKDIIIEKEKKRNFILSQKLKNLEALSKNNFQKKIELENEVKLFRKHYNFSEGEKLISIKFISLKQDINYDIITKNTVKFIKIEYILYEKYPKYMETINYFLSGGNKINRNETLEQNNIKNNDTITLIINNLD